MTPRYRHRNRPIAEMNVVPYIDVMLVLLIIFMITTPLLSQGVDLELPSVKQARTLSPDQVKLIIVSVDAKGDIFLQDEKQPLSVNDLVTRVSALIRTTPKTPVIVRGDNALAYGRMVEVMALLQTAGVPKVGLMTKPPTSNARPH